MKKAVVVLLFIMVAIGVFAYSGSDSEPQFQIGYVAKAIKDCPMHIMPSETSKNVRYPPGWSVVWVIENQVAGIISVDGDWLYVKYDNVVGFVVKNNFIPTQEKYPVHPSFDVSFYFDDLTAEEIENLTIDIVVVVRDSQQIFGYDTKGCLRISGYCTVGRNGYETEKGIWKIYEKESQVYLSGVGYRLPVAYWMPFNRGQGLHDASWRTFLGPWENYKKYGSLGCVNLPYFLAKFLYKHVRVGTTVIVD